MRQTTVLGLLACVLAATGMVTVQATRQSDSFTKVSVADALGAPKPDAPLARRPAEGVKVRIDRKGFQIAGEHGRVSIASAAPSSSRWARYAHGAARPTSFGRETVVVTPEKTEQFLTVERRQGRKTWQWQLGSAGQTPRVGDDGSIAFLERHRLAPMHVEPVAILDERGSDITPEGLRWSVAQGRHGWVLKLRLDDTKLPLPYVIDPAVVYRLAQPSNNGAAGATSITMAVPGGVVNKDLLFMHIAARGGSNMTIATPGGWTALRNVNNGAFVRLATFYRIASSEPGSYAVTFGGTTPSQQAVGAITAYYGVKSSAALSVNGATNTGNSTTPQANSIAAVANALVLAAYSHGAGNGTVASQMFTQATGMIERYDNQSQNATAGNRSAAAMDDILTATAGATGNKPVTASATGRWVAHQVSFLADDVNPASTTTFPVGSANYNAAGWAAGCAPDGICGTASDTDSTVQTVQVSIRQGAGNYWNGTSFGSAVEVWNAATGTTAWNYGFAAGSFPANGSYTVRVRATDVAGNIETPVSATFTYDTVAPALPTGLASSPVGPANDNNPEITGSAEAGSTVQVYPTAACTGGASATGTAAAFASPGLTVTVTDDTSTTFKATATDAAGNVSGCSSASVTYVEDSTAPALPSALASSPVSPANDNNPEITGTAEAGSTVRLYPTAACTGGASATGTAAAFASPGLTVTVTDDTSTTFKATATDAAGNVSGCSSASVTYVEDSTAPALPSALASSPVSPANDNNPEITGSAEAGSTVRVYTTAACTGGAAATGTAAAFASPGLTIAVAGDSSTTFKATATDAAGNVSGCSSSSVTYVEDSTAPALPNALASSPVSPANDNNPEITGTAEAGSTVRLYPTAACTGGASATGTAAAFASPGLTVTVTDDTSTTFKATATDAAGNVSGCSSASVTYVEDSTAPALPSALASSPVSPANDNNPEITGSAEAGSTVRVYTTAACTGGAAATGTAAAFASPGLTIAVAGDSSTTFKATATDAAGNVSGCSSSSVTYVEDSTAPALPASLASSPVGPANDNNPEITGSAEAGSTVRLYPTAACTGGASATGTAAAFASPGLTVTVTDDTSTTFKATATDAAGNVSGCSTSSVTYVEDSTAPALPSGLASSPVSPANDNNPEVTGTAEAGSTVRVYTTAACTGGAAATGTAAAFASPGLTIAVANDSTTTFKATATDASGNVSGCSSSSVTYVEDSTAPALPSALASSPVSPANDNNPEITGSAEAGSTVRIYPTAACTGGAAATGSAAAFASPGLTIPVSDDTSTTFKATATDAAGNVSACSSSSVTYVEDSTAPALPSALASSPVSPANDNNPEITGSAEAGSTVRIYPTAGCTGGAAATGTAAAFASPGLTVAVAGDSSTTFKATATDAAGNVSGCSSSSVTYVEDSTAPALPSALASSPVSPANDNNPEITGSAEAGSTVRVYPTSDCSGGAAATGTAAAFASPGLTVAVAGDSSTTFKATATDAAGNVSGCSTSSVTYVEDSTAPALPSALASSPVSPANDNNPEISGSAEAGSTVRVYITSDCSGGAAATGTAAAFASPGLTIAVANDSATTFKATATDAAGNVSGCSTSSVTYVEDSTAPALPNALASSPASPANDNNPEISGTAEAGSTVRVYPTAACTGGAAATGTAAAFASPGLTIAVSDDTSTTFKATATDAAGNVSGCSSSSVTYVEDSTAPALPASLASSPVSPANDNNPEITGTAEAGSTVSVYTTATCTGGAAATGTAAAFASPGLTIAVSDDTSTTFKATATDAAGNVSGCSSSSVTYVEDSTAPALPSALASSPVSPANDNNPEITGTAEAGSTVRVYTTAACTGGAAATGTAAAFASPGLTIAVANDSTTTFKATATDAAGNVSGCSSSSVTYVEDSTAPALPGSLASSPVGPANDNNPEISGSAEAGSTVRIYTTAGCTGGAAATGTAAAFSSPGLTVGVSDDSSTTFKATATDAAGNVSGCSSSSVTYVEDSTAPALPSALASSPVSPANDNNPEITGSAEAGSTVRVYTTAGCTGGAAATGTAAAFASPGLTIAVSDDTSTTFKATATDAAGNVSGCSSSSVTYVEDSSAPAAPSSLGSTPVSPANDNSPEISGLAEAGSTVRLYTTSDCSGSIAASGSAASFSSPGLTVGVADDSSTIFRATATDVAGNVSSCSAGTTYVEDSSAPAAPSSLASTPLSPANDNNPEISGLAEAGSTVNLYATSDCSGSPAASGNAATFASPGIGVAVADDTTTSFKATSTDAAGNVSACSAAVTYEEDSTAPALPSALASSPLSPANDNSPAISGTAESGSTVNVYATSDCSGAPEATGTAAAFASPGLTVSVSDDSSTTFKATATDAAGNVSGCSSSSVTYVEDSTAPVAPASLASSPIGPANDNAPKISGSAEAGSTVRLYTTFDCSGPVAASGSAAAFSSPGLTVAVADDSTTIFRASATDDAGNVSVCSSSFVTYVEDSSAPAAPASLASSPVSPANDNSPAISGTAEAGSTVNVYATSDCSGAPEATGTAAAFATGLTVAVADDSTTTFKASATDAAGNLSACSSSSVTYVEDSTAPALPSALASSPLSPANDNSPAISGTAESGSTVNVYATSDCSGAPEATGTAAAFASPGLTVSVSDDSSTTFKATATDAAGNVSGCSSSSVTYVEDSSDPTSAVTFPAAGAMYSPAAWNGGCASAGFCGTANDGSGSGIDKVELSIRDSLGNYYDGSSFSSAGEIYLTASGSTSWSYDFADSEFSVDGDYTLHVKATDQAGNVEVRSSRTFVFDSSPPSVPSLSFSAMTNASATGQTVYFRPGAAGGFTVTASASDPHSGIFGYGFPALGTGWSGSQSGADYDYSFSAGASDPSEPNDVTALNNAGLSSSASFTVTPDSLAPVTSISCDGSSCSGNWYTSAVDVSLTANDAESGLDKIRYTTDGSDPSLVNGNDYVAPFNLAVTTTVKFRAYDNVGNEEAVGSQLVRIDDSPPSAPALTVSESPASANQHVSGTTLYYNPQGGNAGSFAVDATTGDAQSGIDKVAFPALAGMTGGGDDSSSPYQDMYSWTASSSASGAQSVVSHNNAGLTASSSFTATPDTAPPSTGFVSYPSGYQTGSVTITTDDGTDALSGVNAATGVIERDSTPLVDGSCDPFPGSWITVTSPDSTIQSGNCYRYRYRVADNVGNYAVYTSGAVVKVSTAGPSAPDLTLSESPASANQHVAGSTIFYNPAGANSGTFSVSATIADSGGSGIDHVSFPALSGMTGGGDDTSSPYQSSYDWTSGSSAAGPQTVTVHNNAGLTSSRDFTVTIDTVPPSGQSAGVTGGYYTALSVPVSLSDGADALSGVDSSSGVVERESGSLSNGSCVGWSGTWASVTLSGGADTTVLTNSCYRYRYTISDNVGNQSGPSSPSLDAKVDATVPVTSDDAAASWQNAALTVTLSVTETGSGVASTVYRVDSGSFQSGTSISVPAPADHSNDGVHTIEYRSTDNAGNVEPLRSATVRIDTTLPTTTDDAPAGWRSSDVTVTLSPSDALSGIASTEFRVDGGVFQNGTSVLVPAPADHSNDGAHLVEYRSTDNAGNVEPLRSATVRIDTELPSGGLTAPAAGAHVNGNVGISAAASDVTSGVASVEFLVRPNGSGSFQSISTDTSAPYDGTWDSTGAAEGNADLEVIVTDNASLTYTSALRTIVVDNPPVPTLVDPGDNIAGTVTLQASSQPDTAQVVFERSLAGQGTWTQIAVDTTAPFTADFDTTGVLDGNYDFRAVATDLGGFDGTSALQGSRVDNTVPSASVTDPASGAVVGGPNVHLGANATDSGSGVASVQFEQRPASGGAFTPIGADTSSPYEASWDTTGLNGAYELRAVATDAAGNQASAATVPVTVDQTAASVTLSDPGRLLRGVVSLTASAPSLHVASVGFERRTAGGSWTRFALDTSRPFEASLDTKTLADGLYDLRAQALGTGGQELATHTREGIRLDNTAPTMVSSTPARGAKVGSATSIVLVASEPVASTQGVNLDGKLAAGAIAGAKVSFSTGKLGPGRHELTGTLVDAAGNAGSFQLAFTVKAEAPAKLKLQVGKPTAKTRGNQKVFTVTLSLSAPAKVEATLLSPAGRKLRTVRATFAAGAHSVKFTVPAASVPPGRYTIRVVATAADGVKVKRRVHVTIPSKRASAPAGGGGNERPKPVAVAAPLGTPPTGGTETPPKTSTEPQPAATPRKPKLSPRPKISNSGGNHLEATSKYDGSRRGKTVGLLAAVLALGAALAFLIRIELGRILASPRR